MTQDEKWLARYNEVVTFLEENHRNPSRHRIEEHDHLNWLKANRWKSRACLPPVGKAMLPPENLDARGQVSGICLN